MRGQQPAQQAHPSQQGIQADKSAKRGINASQSDHLKSTKHTCAWRASYAALTDCRRSSGKDLCWDGCVKQVAITAEHAGASGTAAIPGSRQSDLLTRAASTSSNPGNRKRWRSRGSDVALLLAPMLPPPYASCLTACLACLAASCTSRYIRPSTCACGEQAHRFPCSYKEGLQLQLSYISRRQRPCLVGYVHLLVHLCLHEFVGSRAAVSAEKITCQLLPADAGNTAPPPRHPAHCSQPS